MRLFRVPLGLTLAAFAGSALAHPGHEAAGLMSGFGHPFAGVDHVLAMLAIGLFAAGQRGAARGLLPLAFVLAMIAGVAVSASGVALPAVEAGIAASVLVLGLLIALAARLRLAAALPMVAAFALFHGHAHHAEIGDSALFAYTSGFVIATLLLHGLGFLCARCLPASRFGGAATRVAGGLIAGAGLVLFGV